MILRRCSSRLRLTSSLKSCKITSTTFLDTRVRCASSEASAAPAATAQQNTNNVSERKARRQAEAQKHQQAKYQHSTDKTLLKGYQPVIGLEVHAQMTGASTKVFSPSSSDFGATPNSHVSLIDIASPGTLPRLNEKCVELALMTGLALQGTPQPFSQFDRKHYFYADMPQGYQITQQFHPIIRGGNLDIDLPDGTSRRIRIQRVQIEQDSGKSLHDQDPHVTLIDLNRAGVALMEIISDADMRSSVEAEEYVKKLQFLLRHIGSCDGNMAEGHFRVDVNVSVHKPDEPFGTRCEIKNIASVNYITKAIDYEIKRQIEVLEQGGKVDQETRSYDAKTGKTLLMRSKEDAPDYRYMPEPDLPPLMIRSELVESLRQNMPLLPDAVRDQLIKRYGLSKYDASVLLMHSAVNYFENVMEALAADAEAVKGRDYGKTAANWLINELFALLNQEGIDLSRLKLSPERFAHVVRAVEEEVISNKNAKTLLNKLFEGDRRSAFEIIEQEGWRQINDSQQLLSLCDQILQQYPAEVEKIKQGSQRVAGFIISLIMKHTNGKANARLLAELINKRVQEIQDSSESAKKE